MSEPQESLNGFDLRPFGAMADTARNMIAEARYTQLPGLMGRHASLGYVYANVDAFQAVGVYEDVLLKSYIGTNGSNHHFGKGTLAILFWLADRKRLRNYPGCLMAETA